MAFQSVQSGSSSKRKSDSGLGLGLGATAKKPKVEELVAKGYQTMYRYRPLATKDIGIDRFEEATLKRMKLLSKLFELDGRKAGDGFMVQAKEIVDQPHFNLTDEDDTLSHYALRLALCISERWRQWFVKYELLLFRIRMSAMPARQQQSLLEMNNIAVEEVTKKEVQGYGGQILLVQDADDRTAGEDKYYKVPFQRVLKLVERRKVLIRGGCAFVPHRHVMQLLEATYRASLMAEVNRASKVRVNLEPVERDRILAFLDHVVENHDLEV